MVRVVSFSYIDTTDEEGRPFLSLWVVIDRFTAVETYSCGSNTFLIQTMFPASDPKGERHYCGVFSMVIPRDSNNAMPFLVFCVAAGTPSLAYKQGVEWFFNNA